MHVLTCQTSPHRTLRIPALISAKNMMHGLRAALHWGLSGSPKLKAGPGLKQLLQTHLPVYKGGRVPQWLAGRRGSHRKMVAKGTASRASRQTQIQHVGGQDRSWVLVGDEAQPEEGTGSHPLHPQVEGTGARAPVKQECQRQEPWLWGQADLVPATTYLHDITPMSSSMSCGHYLPPVRT